MAEEWLRRALAADPPGPRRQGFRGIVVAVTGFGLPIVLFVGSITILLPRQTPFLVLLLSLLGTAPMLLRRRQPFGAWALSFVVTVLASAHTQLRPPYPATMGIIYLLCLYTVASRCQRTVAGAVMGVTTVALFVIDRHTIAFVLLCAVPVLLGYTVRIRRVARRTLAEQEERHTAETSALAERQRIARELHDVVAHHMSVIAIQTEAAPYKVADPPPELTESFATIRASALDGLTELRRVLGVLRTENTAQTTPQPGLNRLGDVLASARGGGLSVQASVSGRAVPLPKGVDLSAYRILQEALSNVMRHAPGAAVRVEVGYAPTALRLCVANGPSDRPPPPSQGGGHGLTGMRERAAMLGGELAASPTPDGGFAVSATLPLEAT